MGREKFGGLANSYLHDFLPEPEKAMYFGWQLKATIIIWQRSYLFFDILTKKFFKRTVLKI